jgi:hypothetical protein
LNPSAGAFIASGVAIVGLMVRGAEVMLDDRLRFAIAGNKLLTNRLLAERGLRVARHRPYDLNSVGKAKAFLREGEVPR